MYHKLQWPQEVLKCEPLSGLGNYTLAKRICDSESVLSTTPSRFYQAVFSRAPPSTIFRKCWERITNFHILTFVAQIPSWSSPSLVEVMNTYCKHYLHDLSQVQLFGSKYCSGTKFLWSFVCTSHICMCGCWSFQCSAFWQVFLYFLILMVVFDLNCFVRECSFIWRQIHKLKYLWRQLWNLY